MSASEIITIVLVFLIIAMMPGWKYSKTWGRGYTPSVFLGLMLLAHIYRVVTH